MKLVKSEVVEVTTSVGLTINLGNFESVRVDAGVTIRGDRGTEKSLFEEAWKMVNNEIRENLKRVKQGIKKSKGEE